MILAILLMINNNNNNKIQLIQWIIYIINNILVNFLHYLISNCPFIDGLTGTENVAFAMSMFLKNENINKILN